MTVPPSPPAPSRKPPRFKAWLTHGATALIALLLGAGVAAPEDEGQDTAQAGSASTATATVTAPAAPAPTVTVTAAASATSAPETPAPPPSPDGPATSFSGDGKYLVGEDIEAGTYKTAGPAESVIPNCYWARYKDASGELSSIIANENAQGQTRVTVRKGEYLEVRGCSKWEKTG
ncbi:hypothetical protein ACFY00_33455 [Kitasatospora sp. NPDC001540]|uniref:hypothetical protein n=1 Tax=Kitasatospora sp. NPDC001540 TaxID=3364014 RepID=UPI00367FB1DE